MTNFLGPKNKEFIWDFLLENNLFEGIDPRFKSSIEADLNKVLAHVASLPTFTNLVDKNKEVLRLISQKLINYKQAQSSQPAQQSPQPPPPVQAGLYNSGALQAERQKQLEQQFKKKQEEMNSVLLGNRPNTTPNLSSEPDKPMGAELDKLLEQSLAMRRQQLNQVLERQDPTQAAKFIGNESVIRNIKIGDDTELKKNHIVNLEPADKKQVSFNSEQNKIIEFHEADDESSNLGTLDSFDTSSFLSKLKKTVPQEQILQPQTQQQTQQQSQQQSQQQTQQQTQEIKELKQELDAVNKKLDLILSQQMKVFEILRHTPRDISSNELASHVIQ